MIYSTSCWNLVRFFFICLFSFSFPFKTDKVWNMLAVKSVNLIDIYNTINSLSYVVSTRLVNFFLVLLISCFFSLMSCFHIFGLSTLWVRPSLCVHVQATDTCNRAHYKYQSVTAIFKLFLTPLFPIFFSICLSKFSKTDGI